MDKIIAGITPASKLVPPATAVEVCEYNIIGLSSTPDKLYLSHDTTAYK
jgi:hypothetical protein